MGNPLIKEKMELDVAVTKLKVSKANHTSQQYNLEDSVRKHFPERIAKTEQRITGLEHDLAHMKAQPVVSEGISPMTVMNMTYTDKEDAGKTLLLACKSVKAKESIDIGSYKGFDMSLSYDSFTQEFHLDLQREMTYTVTLSTSETGNILRIDNALDSIEKRLENSSEQLATLNEQLETAKSELGKPFPQEEELQEKLARLAELNAILDIDGNGVENADIAAEKKAEENCGFDISRSSMICCPFHNDDSPSMKLYDDHFYCFGCGEHGDVIDFVSKLFSLSPKDAAERLAHDFGISYDNDVPIDTSKYRKDSILRKIRTSQEKEKENHVYNVLNSYFRLLQDWKRDYDPSSPDDKVDPRFVEALTKSAYIEYLLDRMMAGGKEKIITDNEIVRIEKVMKSHDEKLSENQLL